MVSEGNKMKLYTNDEFLKLVESNVNDGVFRSKYLRTWMGDLYDVISEYSTRYDGEKPQRQQTEQDDKSDSYDENRMLNLMQNVMLVKNAASFFLADGWEDSGAYQQAKLLEECCADTSSMANVAYSLKNSIKSAKEFATLYKSESSYKVLDTLVKLQANSARHAEELEEEMFEQFEKLAEGEGR
jgi:hypothetical protein